MILDTAAAHSAALIPFPCDTCDTVWPVYSPHLRTTLGMEATMSRGCTGPGTGFPVLNHIYSEMLFPRPPPSISSKGLVTVTAMISCFIDLREDFYQYHIYMFAVLATLHEVSKELGMWFTILINDGSGSCFFSLLQPLLSKAHREVPP